LSSVGAATAAGEFAAKDNDEMKANEVTKRERMFFIDPMILERGLRFKNFLTSDAAGEWKLLAVKERPPF
jgi:hypothetical protein